MSRSASRVTTNSVDGDDDMSTGARARPHCCPRRQRCHVTAGDTGFSLLKGALLAVVVQNAAFVSRRDGRGWKPYIGRRAASATRARRRRVSY